MDFCLTEIDLKLHRTIHTGRKYRKLWGRKVQSEYRKEITKYFFPDAYPEFQISELGFIRSWLSCQIVICFCRTCWFCQTFDGQYQEDILVRFEFCWQFMCAIPFQDFNPAYNLLLQSELLGYRSSQPISPDKHAQLEQLKAPKRYLHVLRQFSPIRFWHSNPIVKCQWGLTSAMGSHVPIS